ncbi:hypothetical protein [Streptomyces xanthophaeus]|uniref:hypothetical protein n=1 Tax=Streptomyces xanthophaeus TaxID=67385 RepID=UPI0026494C00|nr:hypothetical protein [Streptomyces xanthophaeus]WKD32848.1 hypothetical protein KO717_13370 [Streptomyces xanthophaeus]
MIGEPELDGEWGPAVPAEVAEGVVERAPVQVRAWPWRWVAATVVATSALWAGGLYAFGERAAEPEIRYRVTDDLCGQFKATALEGLLGGLADASPEAGVRHPALDWASCSRNGDRPVVTGGVHVMATAVLHKKTDPAPEFTADPPGGLFHAADGDGWESVSGLGEEALVSRAGGGGGLALRVRDGGAVFSVTVVIFPVTSQDGADPRAEPLPEPDRESLVAAAVEDARALMAALRTS